MNIANLFKNEPSKLTFKAGDVLIRKGDANDKMFIVLGGELNVVIDGISVAKLNQGDIFGEMSLIDKTPANADIVGAQAGEYVIIDQKRFLFTSQQNPYFALAVMRCLTAKIRAMDADKTAHPFAPA